MEINKRDRSALKAYFVEYALPTEDNFSELIEGMLNQKDDGIVKQPGSPLSLQASGDASSTQKVLSLYEDFGDANAAWTLSLRPRSNPADSTTGRQGLSISTSSGVSRLFVDYATGRVGVGTVDPQAELHVEGDIICSGKINSGQIAPEDWTILPILDSEFEAKTFDGDERKIACYKDPFGIVHLRGYVWYPTGDSSLDMPNNREICNLPNGYRPEQTYEIGAFSHWGATGQITIYKDGRLVLGQHARRYGFTLDCISFPAAPETM